MSACPRCGQTLALHGQGLLRCAQHGVFAPRDVFRGATAYSAAAHLHARLGSGAPAGLACASCRADLRETTLGEMRLAGCATCGGWWFDHDELARLRNAVLGRPIDPPRVVGGYGGNALAPRTHPWGPAIEPLFSVLNGAGAFGP